VIRDVEIAAGPGTTLLRHRILRGPMVLPVQRTATTRTFTSVAPATVR